MLHLWAKDWRSKAAAKTLGLRESTVHRHLANIRRALDVHTSVEMLAVLGRKPDTGLSPLRLTPRGAEVFALLVQGVSAARIGQQLGISYSAVRRHVEKMLFQNKCDTMLELLAKHHGHCADNGLKNP